MLDRRKGFRLTVTPTDGQLWGIGMVAVQWGHIEAWVDMFLMLMTRDDPPSSEVRTRTPSFKERLRQWRALTEIRLVEPQQTKLLSIIDRIGGMQAERDKIIHGQWSDEPDKGLSGPARLTGPKQPFTWNLTYQQVREVALKIDKLNDDILSFIFTFMKLGETLGNALQRISHKPEKNP